MELIHNKRGAKISQDVPNNRNCNSPKNAHPRESRKLARKLHMKKSCEDRPRKKVKLCFETPHPNIEHGTFSKPDFKTPVADFQSKVTFSTRFCEIPTPVRSDSEFNLSPIRVCNREGTKSFLSPILEPLDTSEVSPSEQILPSLNKVNWSTEKREISSSAQTSSLVNKLVFNPRTNLDWNKSIPKLEKKLGEPSEPSSWQSYSKLDLESNGTFSMPQKLPSESSIDISSILPRLEETAIERSNPIFQRNDNKRKMKPKAQPGGGMLYEVGNSVAVPQSAIYARSALLGESKNVLQEAKSECRFSTEGKVSALKGWRSKLWGRSNKEVSKKTKGEGKLTGRSKLLGDVSTFNREADEFLGERFKKKMSVKLRRVPNKKKVYDPGFTLRSRKHRTLQQQGSFLDQSAVFFQKKIQDTKCVLRYLKNIKNPGNVTVSFLRHLVDTPSIFSRSGRLRMTPKFISRNRTRRAVQKWETSGQGCIPRLLSIMIIATLCAFVIDDYKIAERKWPVRAQSRKSEAVLAYEKRCLVDNMTMFRKIFVYINGVVSDGVSGGESNAIYDKECESLLVLLQHESGDASLYAPSIYLKDVSSTTVWNILGTVATALACYNSGHPSLLILSFLLATMFFTLGMLKNFVIDLPILRWFWGVVPDT